MKFLMRHDSRRDNRIAVLQTKITLLSKRGTLDGEMVVVGGEWEGDRAEGDHMKEACEKMSSGKILFLLNENRRASCLMH